MSKRFVEPSPEAAALLHKLYPDPVKRARMTKLFVEAVVALRACKEAKDPISENRADPGDMDGETTVIMFRSGPGRRQTPSAEAGRRRARP